MIPLPSPVTVMIVNTSHGQIVGEGHDVFDALQDRHKYVLIKKEECEVVYTTW